MILTRYSPFLMSWALSATAAGVASFAADPVQLIIEVLIETTAKIAIDKKLRILMCIYWFEIYKSDD